MNGTVHLNDPSRLYLADELTSYGRLAIRHKSKDNMCLAQMAIMVDVFLVQEDIETFHGDQARRRAFSSGWIGQVKAVHFRPALPKHN